MRKPAIVVATGLVAAALALTGSAVALPVPAPVISTPAPARALRQVAFTPVADSTTEVGLSVPLGTAPYVTADASPARVAYLRFDTRSLQGEFARAVLLLHVADDPTGSLGSGSVSGGGIRAVADHEWTEAGLIELNRPRTDGMRLDLVDAVTPGSWVQFDVSRALRSGGLLDLAITTASTDGVRYDSRESPETAPQLIVSVGRITPPSSGIVLATVGDMACAPGTATTADACHQRAISDLIVQDPQVQSFLALGDLQYRSGSLAEFASYDRSFGRVNDLVAPVIGNHEYVTPGAAGYFEYFRTAGVAARLQLGGPADAYYSFDLGSTWHVVVLNSNCSIVSCAAGSAQERWLRADLAASARPCTIVAWHHPRFASSAVHASDPAVAALWQAAQDTGVEIALAGHDHQYERFAPQDNNGVPTPDAPREFVVGTGGVGLYAFTAPQPNSELRISAFGYLRLDLRSDGYAWQFIGEQRTTLDSGSATCHRN